MSNELVTVGKQLPKPIVEKLVKRVMNTPAVKSAMKRIGKDVARGGVKSSIDDEVYLKVYSKLVGIPVKTILQMDRNGNSSWAVENVKNSVDLFSDLVAGGELPKALIDTAINVVKSIPHTLKGDKNGWNEEVSVVHSEMNRAKRTGADKVEVTRTYSQQNNHFNRNGYVPTIRSTVFVNDGTDKGRLPGLPTFAQKYSHAMGHYGNYIGIGDKPTGQSIKSNFDVEHYYSDKNV